MDVPYLADHPWAHWTRDERFFCAVLFGHARSDTGFAPWLIEASELGIDPAGDWDLGYGVCLYRDFLWQRGGSAAAHEPSLPAKRTFDLCLFGKASLIIVEAKVCEPFAADQNVDFARDRDRIHSLPGLKDVGVKIVALATACYFSNASKYGRTGTLDVFDGRVTWEQVAARYDDPVLSQACGMYRCQRGGLIDKSPA